MENKVTLVDELKETIEMIKNTELIKFLVDLPYHKYTLTIIGFAILYFFYQLGYVFLYGFYFGGDGQRSIFNIIINPVPFNFKSIIGVGVLLLVFMSMFCIPLIRILFTRFNIYVVISLLASSFVIIFSLAYMFFGRISIEVLGLASIALGVPFLICYTIYVMINFKSYLKLTVISILYCFIILFILDSFDYVRNINQRLIMIFLTNIYIFVLIPIINKRIEKFNSKKRRILGELIGLILFIIIILRYQNTSDEGIYLSIIIYFIISTYIEIIKNNTITIIRNKIMGYILINDKENNNDKFKSSVNICARIISIIFIYPIVSSGILIYGNYMGDVIMKSYSPNKINYEFNKDNLSSDEKEGIVVAQQGDTYYISQLPARKLVIIKSKSVVVE